MSDFPISGSNQNNVQNNYEYDKNSLIAEMNGLNHTTENTDAIEDADGHEEQLNPPQVVKELTDVPVLSDALVSKNKALQLFRSPLETHDTFERTLQRKHKFNFFEKFLCVISFGLASPLINHLNKSNDRKEAMELKNNTLAVNYALANFPKDEHSNSVNVDLFNDGKVIHAQIERNEKNQLFIKLPRMEQKIRLPYDLEHMKTLISTDICSHIDIFGLESALISLDAENKDINRRGLLTNILSHMTGGEKKYDELSVMDFNSLESIVRDIRNNSETLRESGSSDADIFQSNRTFLENELKKVEAKHQLIATKLNSSLVQKEALYNESIAKIEDQIYQSNLNKLTLELNAQKTQKAALEKAISEKSTSIAFYLEKKDLTPEDLQAKRVLEFELETATKNRTRVADKIADLEKRIDTLNNEHENLLAQRAQDAQDNPVPLNNLVIPEALGESGKHSQKVNSIYVNSIIEKLETEKKETPQSVSQKVNTSVILNGTDNKFIKQKEVLQNKIELVKGYGAEYAKKYTDGLRSLKENSQNKLKNFYTADFLASKIIGLNSAFNHNHILKAEYEDKLYKLESEIDKLKTSQDPVVLETLKHLNTELNNLKKNPTYLSDEKLIKNMVLENKEIFAAINAEINKIMQETKATNPESAFKNTSIGKIINSEVGDIVCSLCREIGFDKVTAGDIDSSLTAFDMKNSIASFFSSIGSFFGGGDAPNSEEKKSVDPFFVKVSRIPNAISSMSVVKLQNLTEELSIALRSKNFTYEQFKALKGKYIAVISFFENPNNKNYINQSVPEKIRNLLLLLNIVVKDEAHFNSVISRYKKAEEFSAIAKEIDSLKGKGLTIDKVLTNLISDDTVPPLKISENKPLFRLFSELVKSNNSKDIQKNLQRFKPYMSKSDYSVISKFASVFSGFLGSNYIKGKLNSNKNTDITGLFKEMVESCLASGLKSPISSVVEQLEKDVTNEELRKTRDDFLGVVKNSCQHRMCENFASLFAAIENRDVETGLKEIEDLTNQGNLDEDAMKSVLENHPSLLVHAFNKSFPEGMTPQQTYLSGHLILAFAPLLSVLNQTYTSGQSKVKLESSDYRELADKLLYTFNHDPLTFNKKLYNPITQDLRDMFSDAMYTVTTTIPKSVPGVTLTSTEAIGSASLSDNGAFDFKTALDKVNDDTLAVRNAQWNYILFDLDIVSSFANDQKELTVEQRAFWVHNFLADLIFEEDGREYDKSIDKIEKDAPDAIQPGAKLLRLLKKHAKALSYMIKDPLALNTLPSVIKPQVEALVKQIRESGLEILVDKNTDIFTDRQLENGADFIKALLNFDINKANSDLTPKQLEIKLSLISAEKTLEDSVDTILENVSEMINSPEVVHEHEVQAEPVAQEGEAVNGEAVNAEDGNAQNPPVDKGDMSDPLNPNSTLKSLNESSGNKDDVMTQFVTNVRKNYFNKLSKMDKLSMVSASIRYSRADKKGFISTDKMIGSAFKGAGPIMQKMLQKTPQKEISEELKKSFSDMKSNLAPIPEAVVQAHLLQIVNNSDGKVKKIEIQRSLGAASVGEAFLCKVYTADKPEGVDCVIKILRPDVMNKAHRELEIFREAAKNIPGMDVTFEGALKSIMEELDLTIEAQNIISGQVYNNFDPNVQSMKLFDLVPPSTDVLIIEKAPGVTVNCVINSLENKVLDDILKPVTKIESRIPGLEAKAQYTSIEGFLAETDEITPSESDFVDMHSKLLTEYKELIEQRNNLVKFSKEWVSQGIFETGFYHGDLHAGNIMTSKDKLTVIDFGNCIKLKPYQQENIIRMMAASIDSNGNAFMEGLKNLLSESSLSRMSEVRDYNGVQMTVEQHLTDVISAILKKGNEDDTGLRIKLAMEAILKEGIEIPAPIYNFELCQLSLQNTIDEMNSQIDTVRKLFLKLGLIRGDTRSNSLCPTASFAKKAVKIFINIEQKDQSKALLKLYNEELDNLLKDPEDELKQKVKYVGALTFSLDFSDQTDSVKGAFCFMDDPKFKELYEKWQGPRLENENKTNKNQEITLAEQRAEDDSFDEFFAYYKEKVSAQMQQEFEILKNFLEEKNKEDADFLTGMSEVLQTYKWDAVKTLGIMTSIKYGINSLFA